MHIMATSLSVHSVDAIFTFFTCPFGFGPKAKIPTNPKVHRALKSFVTII
jgi:hypothetical protein